MGTWRRRLCGLGAVPMLVIAGFAPTLPAPREVSAATTVGDASWFWRNPLPQGNSIADIACPNRTSCFAVAGGILHTADGGNTWISQPTATSDLSSISCSSSLMCLAVGSHGGTAVTTDGGLTWNARPIATDWNLSAIACPSNDVCYSLAANPSSPHPAPSRVFVTMDGGNSWTDRTPVTSAPLSSISCPITTMCIAVGMAGTILQTWNNGLRWDARASGTGEDLGTIRCPTTYHCYVTAGAGIILATDSAGNIWTSHDTGIPPEGWLAGLSCPSVLTCYATGYKGLMTGWLQKRA